MGFGMFNLIDPSSHAQVTIVAEWEQLVALLVFLVLDVHHLLIEALLASFRTAPPGAVVLAAGGLQTVFHVAGDVFGIGVRIAAPVVIVLLMTNAALGVLARSIPQLNVFVLGFPVNVGVGCSCWGRRCRSRSACSPVASPASTWSSTTWCEGSSMADDADRTESATPKRREEARKKGQVLLSPELSPIAVLLTAVTIATVGGPLALARTRGVLATWLAAVGPTAVHDDPTWPLVARALQDILGFLAPFFLATGAAGVAAVVAQVGFKVTPELLVPDFGRISPAKGFKRLFSPNAAAELLKSIVKIGLVLLLAYSVITGFLGDLISTPGMALPEILGVAGSGLHRLLVRIAVVLLVFGAADWFWQRRRHEQSLKMSRQEVKQESKDSEGDPLIRGRFKRAHRELAKRRMLAEVKTADVVLTNPTHYAVALRYQADEMRAPRVVAKGVDEVAQRIKDEARHAGVPIVERRALARALFRSVQLGGEIPPALYRAVAEILAYIYSLRRAPGREVR
jgi:flagellar biosynthetic protein FliR/FlhB